MRTQVKGVGILFLFRENRNSDTPIYSFTCTCILRVFTSRMEPGFLYEGRS